MYSKEFSKMIYKGKNKGDMKRYQKNISKVINTKSNIVLKKGDTREVWVNNYSYFIKDMYNILVERKNLKTLIDNSKYHIENNNINQIALNDEIRRRVDSPILDRLPDGYILFKVDENILYKKLDDYIKIYSKEKVEKILIERGGCEMELLLEGFMNYKLFLKCITDNIKGTDGRDIMTKLSDFIKGWFAEVVIKNTLEKLFEVNYNADDYKFNRTFTGDVDTKADLKIKINGESRSLECITHYNFRKNYSLPIRQYKLSRMKSQEALVSILDRYTNTIFIYDIRQAQEGKEESIKSFNKSKGNYIYFKGKEPIYKLPTIRV